MTAIANRTAGAVATKAPKRTLAERLGYEPDTLEFIRAEIANGAPDPQLEYFLRLCQARGLDPTAREIYYIPRNDSDGGGKKWTAQIGIDGYRAMAERTGLYDGQDAPVYTYDADGKLESATVVVYRKGNPRGIPGTAFYSEYVQRKNGSPTKMWAQMPRNQLAKCAEALALRKAFPRNLGGIYAGEEMDQAANALVNVTRTLPAGATRAAQLSTALAAQAQPPPADATLIDESKPGPQAADLARLSDEELGEKVADEAQARGLQPADVTPIIKKHGGLKRSTAQAILAEICEHPIIVGDGEQLSLA